MTPKESVRKFCVSCVDSVYQTEHCGGDKMIGQGNGKGECYFYPFRNGKGRPSVKLIRRFCVECMQGSPKLVSECPSTNCSLFKFRFGRNPNRAGIGKKTANGTVAEQGFFEPVSMESQSLDSIAV